MNRFFNKKNLAFTLAEMMVVLALFSVVSAATLPVITARQQAGVGDGAEGSAEDPWKKNTNYNSLSYLNSNAQSNTSAVMIGGQITDESASDLGYPQLIVTDNVGTGSDGNSDASQIIFLKRNGSKPYYAGRIMMENNGAGAGGQSTGSVAIGANALAYNSNTTSRIYNVAIGSSAMNIGSGSSSLTYSVAIGNNALRSSGSGAVAIGNYASYGSGLSDSVVMGNYAGYAPGSNKSHRNTVIIGDRAGNWHPSSNAAGISYDNVYMGTYASYQSSGQFNVVLGTYAGYTTQKDGFKQWDTLIGHHAGAALNFSNHKKVAVGYYAGYASYGAVSIGYRAGYKSNINNYSKVYEKSEGGILIGYNAGYSNAYDIIAIGNNAGHTNTSSVTQTNKPVYIGTQAGYLYGMYGGSTSSTGSLPAVVMGYRAGYAAYGAMSYAIMIGTYAGEGSKNMYASVCIGKDACRGEDGGGYSRGHFVRITSKGRTRAYSSGSVGQSHIGDVPSTLESNTTLWNNASYDSMLITPLYGGLTYTTDSSILLFGDVFSKSTALKAFSDRRLKENIRPAKYGLKDIRRINIYNYTWKDDSTNASQIGVIAQEMQKIIPEGVTKSKNGYLSVSSTWLVYPMVNAIKELDTQVTTMKNGLVAYAKEYVYLVQRVNALEKEVKSIEQENNALTNQVKAAYTKAKKAENSR